MCVLEWKARQCINPFPHYSAFLKFSGFVVVVQLLSYIQLLATPWTTAHQASLSFTISWSLLKLMSIESAVLSNCFIPCYHFLLLLSVFPSIRGFGHLMGRWPKYWNLSFSNSPSSEYSVYWFHLLAVQGLSRVISSTTIQKQQFFSIQPCLWSNSHICTWLLEKS